MAVFQIASGGDLLLGYAVGSGGLYNTNGSLDVSESDPLTAAIYTAGVPSVLSAAQAALFSPTNVLRPSAGAPAFQGAGEPAYPTDGGSIEIQVGDDIRSALSAQTITDWLWRRGASSTAQSQTAQSRNNASWWVMFNDFDQGIGALGGGEVSVSAGRDIVNTSIVVPTTGRVLASYQQAPVAGDIFLTGGGNLSVTAGNNIISGVLEDDWGNTVVTAGGAVTSSADSTIGQLSGQAGGQALYPILSVGNGTFSVNARAGIELDGVTNSTTLPVIAANSTLNVGTFFAYAPNSNPGTLSLTSTTSDIVLNADSTASLPIATGTATGTYATSSARLRMIT